MRIEKMKWTLIIVIGLTITGCVISNPKFFENIELTKDASYGYTAENPVTIKNADLNNSINSSYYYLSRLRTEKGNKLKLVRRYSIDNPKYKKPAIPIYDRSTGLPINSGGGFLLDVYILKAANEPDTFKIYINPYLKGTIKVPNGLYFEKEN